MSAPASGSIAEYIAERKKHGMTWEQFRELKAKRDDSLFNDKEMKEYRKVGSFL
jgi:hypothetical protein